MSKEKEDDDGEVGGGEEVRSKENDTALHVIKGAIVNALGPRAAVTAGVRFSTLTKATITIQYVGDKPEDTAKPSEADIARIQTEATKLVAANLPVKEFTMEKAAAEAKYKANPVNHTYVYDAFPIKAGLKELSIVEIPNCNVNACQGPHCKTTGELLGVFLQKQKYSKAKKQHSFSFVCGQAAVDGLAVKQAEEAKLAAQQKLKALAKSGPKTDAKPAGDAGAAPAAAGAGDKKKDNAKGKDKKQSDAKDQKSAAGSGSASAAAAAPAAGGAGVGYTPSALETSTNAVVDSIVLATLQKPATAGGAGLSAEAVAALRPGLYAAVKAELNLFQSGAYLRGYTAQVQRQQNIQDRL